MLQTPANQKPHHTVQQAKTKSINLFKGRHVSKVSLYLLHFLSYLTFILSNQKWKDVFGGSSEKEEKKCDLRAALTYLQ